MSIPDPMQALSYLAMRAVAAAPDKRIEFTPQDVHEFVEQMKAEGLQGLQLDGKEERGTYVAYFGSMADGLREMAANLERAQERGDDTVPIMGPAMMGYGSRPKPTPEQVAETQRHRAERDAHMAAHSPHYRMLIDNARESQGIPEAEVATTFVLGFEVGLRVAQGWPEAATVLIDEMTREGDEMHDAAAVIPVLVAEEIGTGVDIPDDDPRWRVGLPDAQVH